jgi:succinate dehydrogenase / fumarate reductase iron-sulfur subunit
MSQGSGSVRAVQIFRYDPEKGGDGHFQSYELNIPNETKTTILDVLLRLQREQDPTIAFRYACRVNMCGSCGMVINGNEGLACKTNVSDIPHGKQISIRPLNHFPVIKDLVVDMEPLFRKYESILPFFEPKAENLEPYVIKPDSQERLDIAMDTDCISCGCCVSSCTMAHYHDSYAGPAPLSRAFTLLVDSRDALFEERLERALASCYDCRTEFNCTEVCPKKISGTRAIKYIQRLALKHMKKTDKPPPYEEPAGKHSVCGCAKTEVDRRTFLTQVGAAVLGLGLMLGTGGVVGSAFIGPTLAITPKKWLPVAPWDQIPFGEITTINVKYEQINGIYTQQNIKPVIVKRTDREVVCFDASCPHLGCLVKWDQTAGQLRCACHGGAFDADGNVIAGPPPRPLQRFPYKIDGGTLYVEVV